MEHGAALCKEGAGICIVMEVVGDADPAGQRELPDLPPIPISMWLVAHGALRTCRRIRVGFDHLADGRLPILLTLVGLSTDAAAASALSTAETG